MIEQISIRNAAAWHRHRQRDVTASVAGALLGLHEWISPYELWALKSGLIDADPEESEAMKRGRLLEPVAVQLLGELRPTWGIVHNSGAGMRYFRDAASRLGGTPDVLADDPDRGPGVVQIKSVERSTFRRKWEQEDGSIEPPTWIAVQAIVEAYLTGSQWAAVAPLVIGHGIELPIIDIPMIPGVIERVAAESRAFWQMVESGEEPIPDYSRDAGVIDRLYSADDGDEVDLSQDERIHTLVVERAGVRRALAANEKAAAEIDAEIKARMKGASIAYLKGGKRITWKMQRRPGPDGRAALFRVLRVPEPD